MDEKIVIGIVSRRFNEYILTTDEGKEYKLRAIRMMEAVPPQHNTVKFEKFVGKRVEATGHFSNGDIWNAFLRSLDEEDSPPDIQLEK